MYRLDVTTFGETMLRYSVPSGERLGTMSGLNVHVGGAESNVVAALACLDRRCGWVSAVPAHDLGDLVLRNLRAFGVDTRAVVRSGARAGTYYVEFAAPPRPVNVIYDRQGSAVTSLTPDDIDWGYLLDTRVLHLTGITPALSEGCLAITRKAISRAKAKGVTVCFDVNYRSKLWSAERAQETLLPLVREVDVLICGAGDAGTVFGVTGPPKTVLAELSALTKARYGTQAG